MPEPSAGSASGPRPSPSSSPNPATLWARVLIDELVRAGVRELCLAPGSRSTPLVLAAARRDELRLRVFIDERSAGFFALGLGKATGRPAVVLTTSGTAVANLLPAVVEASQAEVPLLVLTADRPPRLRDLDANQAIRQPGIFGDYPRWQADLAVPTPDELALRHLRGQMARAVGMALGLPAGPVHVNAPFDKPLEPTAADDVAGAAESAQPAGGPDRGGAAKSAMPAQLDAQPGAQGRPDGAPFTRVSAQRPRASDAEVEQWAMACARATRGVIVAGPHPEAERLGPILRKFAARSGFVLLADPLSGARWGVEDDAPVPLAADLWLGAAAAGRAADSAATLAADSHATLAGQLAPDLILRVGAAPTSARVLAWLERHAAVRQVVVDAGARWKDSLASAHEIVRCCPIDLFERVVAHTHAGRADGASPALSWLERWMRADRAALGAVDAIEALSVASEATADAASAPSPATAELREGAIARAVVATLPPAVPLFVSSSMPVRDVDAYGGARAAPLVVHGNRGASGIDGIASTALGVAAGSGKPVVALVGDLAFLHDLNGLLATREPDARVIFVVIDNDGGGIFHMLPVAEHEPAFTPYFATPHGLDLSQAAALFSLRHRRIGDVAELTRALGEELARMSEEGGEGPGTASVPRRAVILELKTDRAANRAAHEWVRCEAEARAMEVAMEAFTRRPRSGTESHSDM